MMVALSFLGDCRNRGFAKLPEKGVSAMRILSKRQVKELVLYSPQHIARLEAAGQFPKRVRLGANRVGWVESEVLDWLQERIDRREDPDRHS
jgi:prophage regulatory protein